MDTITHYTCTGSCGGISPEVKTCDTPGCTHMGSELKACGCTDGSHNHSPEE